jgi:hypothetical protein
VGCHQADAAKSGATTGIPKIRGKYLATSKDYGRQKAFSILVYGMPAILKG